jgi:signal transduction histidine kinase
MSEDSRIEQYIRTLEKFLEGDWAVVQKDGDLNDPMERLGSAIERLIAQTKVRETEASLLQSITTRVSTGLTLEDMLDYIYAAFRDVIPYQRMGLALIEADGLIVISRWARSDQPDLLLGEGFAAPLEGSSLQSILDTNRPRILNDLKAYLEQKPSSTSTRLIVEEGFQSSLTCPLIANGQPVGFLFFTSREKAAYANRHIDIFIQIAGQISILLEKGRLVSELTGQKKYLEKINEELQQRNDARKVILAIAAHDLRAPLSYIKTSTDLLLSDKDDVLAAETPELIAGISRQARHLLDLLDKLLDYSMIEAGQMSISPECVDLKSWISEVIAKQDPDARAKNIRIEICPLPSEQIEMDPLRMEQVMMNLLSNALKFSPKDSLVCVEVNRKVDRWHVSVSDQGPGIHPVDVDRLFRPFQRGLSQPTAGEKSTGLGLSIARSIVLAHGGEIGVSNNPEAGATFWFTVPV